MEKMNNYKYKNLDTLRKAHGFTVDELMNKIGYSGCRSKYYSWQNGGNIKIADIIALHDIFCVSTDCILDIKPLQISSWRIRHRPVIRREKFS